MAYCFNATSVTNQELHLLLNLPAANFGALPEFVEVILNHKQQNN